MKPAIRTTFLIFLVFAAFSKAETIGNSSPSEAPSLVTISVFDRANVPTELLTVAEEEARRIFLHAGVETTWLNCSKPLAVRQSKAMSRGTIGAGYLVVEILPRANSEQLRFRLGVRGTATLTDKGEGFYCYLFYDRIERLSGERSMRITRFRADGRQTRSNRENPGDFYRSIPENLWDSVVAMCLHWTPEQKAFSYNKHTIDRAMGPFEPLLALEPVGREDEILVSHVSRRLPPVFQQSHDK